MKRFSLSKRLLKTQRAQKEKQNAEGDEGDEAGGQGGGEPGLGGTGGAAARSLPAAAAAAGVAPGMGWLASLAMRTSGSLSDNMNMHHPLPAGAVLWERTPSRPDWQQGYAHLALDVHLGTCGAAAAAPGGLGGINAEGNVARALGSCALLCARGAVDERMEMWTRGLPSSLPASVRR